jgi:hypothetical protein
MRITARTTTRIAAYAASGVLAVSGTLVSASPAGAVTYDPQPAAQAANWLEGELADGLMHNPTFGGFDDYGLSIDTALALAAVGGHAAAVQQVADAIAANIGNYIGTGAELYSGAAAKSAVLAQEAGEDPSTFGGVDRIGKIESTVSSTSPMAGRLEDQSAYGDYANSLGQSLAARSLSTADSPKAAAVTAYLLKQQCSSGYFRLNFSPKDAANQSCVDGTDAADTDATAFSVLQLASQSSDPAVAAAITKAKAWLAKQQRCDGSFGGGTSTEVANANSTGLTAWAFGDSPVSRQAAGWLRTHQVTAAESSNALGDDTGAIAYSGAALTAGRTDGITDDVSDQWRRATAQAAPGARWYSSDATPKIQLAGPSGYRRQGSRLALRATGAGVGSVLCLTGTSASARGVASGSGWSSTVTLPAGTRTRVYTLKDAYGHVATHSAKVLGAKRLTVTRSQYRVKRARYVTVTVKGLASREPARVLHKGRVVRRGTANASGRFVARFKVTRALGRTTLWGQGQFTDIRRGSTVIKVVR